MWRHHRKSHPQQDNRARGAEESCARGIRYAGGGGEREPVTKRDELQRHPYPGQNPFQRRSSDIPLVRENKCTRQTWIYGKRAIAVFSLVRHSHHTLTVVKSFTQPIH